jgi:hypothetical protein
MSITMTTRLKRQARVLGKQLRIHILALKKKKTVGRGNITED